MQSLEPNGFAKPLVEVPDGDTLLKAATQAIERLDELRASMLQMVHNASHRRLLEYNETQNSSHTTTFDPSRLHDSGVSDASGDTTAEAVQLDQLVEPEYPFLGPLSAVLEAVDTKEEVLDMMEDATMDVIHTAFGQTDPQTSEWRPPTHAQKSFGSNAWHGLACMWMLLLVLMAVGVLYNRSRRAWLRTMQMHSKYL